MAQASNQISRQQKMPIWLTVVAGRVAALLGRAMSQIKLLVVGSCQPGHRE
jgi:hypothetical protein